MVFLFTLALGGLSFGLKTARIAIALTLGDSLEVAELHKAVDLDPSNAELHLRLGLLAFYSVSQPDPVEGLAHLRRAAELNPGTASYWSRLGLACESVRDDLCAGSAFERTLNLSPSVLRYRWMAANHYLRVDQADLATAQFHKLLDLIGRVQPKEMTAAYHYTWPTFELCLRALENPQIIFQKVVGESDPRLKLDFIYFLSARGKSDSAYQLWTQTLANTSVFPFALAQPYLNHLIELGRYHDAVGVWQDLERLGVVQRSALQKPDDLVFNGSFEQAPLNAGFDWRYSERPYVSVDFSAPGAYEGARCLRLAFMVKENEEYEPVFQYVPVVPGTVYSLTAYTRSQDIASDSGPRLRVTDTDHPGTLDVTSETTVGTTPWHALHLSFSAGPQTSLIRLSVWRPRSRSYPMDITGTFWVDAVSVVPSG